MSERVPKRKLYDEVQVMNTDSMRERGLDNKRGKVIAVLEFGFYMVEISDDTGLIAPVKISGASLRAWVEPLKEDLK